MTRVVMALLLGAAILAAIWYLPANEFRWLILAVIAVGAVELTRMRFTDQIERWAVIVGTIVVGSSMILNVGHPGALLLLVLALFAIALVIMRRANAMPGVADRLGFGALSLIYLGVAMPFWSFLRVMDHGQWWVLMALVPACMCDTFAYLVGKAVGRRKFAPKVSPNKTVEGFMGALAGSLVGAFAVWFWGGMWIPWWQVIIIALIMWWVSPMGDLIESMIKRSTGVKDSGTIIKGHGGILDRLDALVFSGPVMYAFVAYFSSPL